MRSSSLGAVLFLGGMALFALWMNLHHRRNAPSQESLEQAQLRIAADLSNLPDALGPADAPVTVSVRIHPKLAGPCDKGTVEFVRQMIQAFHPRVRAVFHKVYDHAHSGAGCSASLEINGKKTFTVTMGGRTFKATIHGVARPGDPMSDIVRQAIEQEIALAERKGKEVQKDRSKKSASLTRDRSPFASFFWDRLM
ncbi:MAG: hypothetical protein NZ959_11390 [Armatimonadetes bacterium]|nr:hypothetical protein [Armatimonadota bacterium]MDW8122935.1 hypothetical protein [Armatimonadota bacterium]